MRGLVCPKNPTPLRIFVLPRGSPAGSGFAARKLSWTPYVLSDGQPTEYGFGWFVDQDRGSTRLTHNGETRGFTNAIVRYPDQRLTVIVLTNLSNSAPWDAAQNIADVWLGPGAAAEPASRWPFQEPGS